MPFIETNRKEIILLQWCWNWNIVWLLWITNRKIKTCQNNQLKSTISRYFMISLTCRTGISRTSWITLILNCLVWISHTSSSTCPTVLSGIPRPGMFISPVSETLLPNIELMKNDLCPSEVIFSVILEMGFLFSRCLMFIICNFRQMV